MKSTLVEFKSFNGKSVKGVFQEGGDIFIDFSDGTHVHIHGTENDQTQCHQYPFPSYMEDEMKARANMNPIGDDQF